MGAEECLTIVHCFQPETENFDFGKKMIPYNSTSQGEQNVAKLSFIAPSSTE